MLVAFVSVTVVFRNASEKGEHLILRNRDLEIWRHFLAVLSRPCLIQLLSLSKAEFPAVGKGLFSSLASEIIREKVSCNVYIDVLKPLAAIVRWI